MTSVDRKNIPEFLKDSISFSPYDSTVFGFHAYEIKNTSEDVLKGIFKLPGHYTIKKFPLSKTQTLHNYGFYYCDTLIEPYCHKSRFVYYKHKSVSISRKASFNKLVEISNGAFLFGRFHRDFNIDNSLADLRYANWLKQLYERETIFIFLFNEELAGFLGYTEHRIVLHALKQKFKGKGLAKFFFSAAIKELFNNGYDELVSSISAANMPVLNLYASLGFRFRNPMDVYHRIVTEEELEKYDSTG